MKILKLIMAFALISLPTLSLANQCSKFGNPSFSANRVFKIGPKTQRSKVYVSGDNVREEASQGGKAVVRIFTRKGMLLFNPEKNTGIFLKAPPKKLNKGKRRLEEKKVGRNIEITSYIKGKSGQWVLDTKTICTTNGVTLSHAYNSVNEKKVISTVVTQSNVKLGPQSQSLFKAPAGLKLLKGK